MADNVRLRATRDLVYATRRLRAGDVFEAKRGEARILRALKKVEPAERGEARVPPPPEDVVREAARRAPRRSARGSGASEEDARSAAQPAAPGQDSPPRPSTAVGAMTTASVRGSEIAPAPEAAPAPMPAQTPNETRRDVGLPPLPASLPAAEAQASDPTPPPAETGRSGPPAPRP
jgi:hypothetical protein